MFYNLLISFLNTKGNVKHQTLPFKRYDNAYAFMSRKMTELLDRNRTWRISSDAEARSEKGWYTRTVMLVDPEGNLTATLKLENEYFYDGLIEGFTEA